jgi:hypothetical protein
VPKSKYCHVLPEVLLVHAGKQEIIILTSNFVARIAVRALPAFSATVRENRYKESKGVMSSDHLSFTSLGITGIEDKQRRPRQNIFSLVWSGTFLQYGISTPS